MAVKYYIATPEGKTEGPFYPETLEVMERRKSITLDTIICREGGHEWIAYGDLLSSKAQEKAEQTKMGIFNESEKNTDSNSQIAGAFRGVGIVCFVLAVVIPLLLLTGKNSQPVFAAALFLVLALSGLGWLGVGVIIRLLEQIAENTGKR